jgi:hypothetical protein
MMVKGRGAHFDPRVLDAFLSEIPVVSAPGGRAAITPPA